jgi:hypothetical protein
MKNLFSTRKRRVWAAVLMVAVLIAGGLRIGAGYIASWRSTQYQAYNLGIALYTNGDRVCKKEEAKDPMNNHCLDIDGTVKIFGASIQAYVHQQTSPNPVEQFILPPGSQDLASLAALHQGILLIIKKKPEEAIKALKMAIMLADIELATDDSLNVDSRLQPNMFAEREAARKRLQAVKLKAQHDLELLFKKNPSQAAKEGKGQPQQGQQGQGQPDPSQGQGDPDEQPGAADPAGKHNRNRI